MRFTFASRVLTAVLCCALFVVTGTAAQRALTGWRLIRVADLDSGRPVPYAVVRLQGGNQRQSVQLASDGEGRAFVQGLVSGQYRISASAEGYIATSEGGDQPLAFTVASQDTGGQLRIGIQRAGAIAGGVQTSSGDPVPGMDVRAQRVPLTHETRAGLPRGASATTDDQGRFSLTGLTPGSYIVTVSPRVLWKGPEAPMGLAPVGDTTDSAGLGSPLIAVAGGSEVQIPPIVLDTVRFRTVRGQVVGGVAPGMQLVLRDLRTLASSMADAPTTSGSYVARVEAQGTFVFTNVPDGQYRLVGSDDGNRQTAPGNSAGFVSQPVVVDSTSGDIVALRVPGLTVGGRIELDIEPGVAGPRLPARLRLVPVRANHLHVIGTSRDVTVDTQGRFLVDGVVPSVYEIRFDNPEGARVMVRHGDGQLSATLDLRADMSAATLVVTSRFGRLEGSIDIDRMNQRTVVVFPDDPRTWDQARDDGIRFVERTVDVEGRFVVDQILPGSYRVAVVDRSAPGAWRSRDGLTALAGAAERFIVRAFEVHHVTLRATR